MGIVLRFIAWAWSYVWRFGAWVIGKIVAWARANWATVAKWIARGVSWVTILDWIRQILGL